MKIKIPLLSIVFLFVSVQVSAKFGYGVRGGINNVVNISSFNTPGYSIEYEKGQAGFHLGGIAQVKLASFFVQPELLFTVARADLRLTKDIGGVVEKPTGSQSFRKIDMPVMMGMKFGPLKVQAGPVATMMLGTKSALLDQYTIDQSFDGATVGYQAGLGLELANLLLDIKYEGNLSKFGNSITVDGNTVNTDQRMSQWLLSIGFLIN